MSDGMKELMRSVGLLTVAVVLAFAPDAYFVVLARAFILPAMIILLSIAAVTAWYRRWWVAQAALFGTGLLAVQLNLPDAPDPSAASYTGLRVLQMNVLQPNTAHDAAIVQALESDADLISVQEVSPEWAQALQSGLQRRYPYVHIEPRTDCYGIALFSKHPFQAVRTITMRGDPFVEAYVEVHGRPVRMLAVHATSPISYGHFRRRNDQLELLGRYVARDDTATILIGDLNTVPWDQAFRRFCSRSGLHSLTPLSHRTWPSVGPFAVIPLDHVLATDGISSTTIRTVPIKGSDHRALIADLQLPRHAP